jgi:hypothetical protein
MGKRHKFVERVLVSSFSLAARLTIIIYSGSQCRLQDIGAMKIQLQHPSNSKPTAKDRQAFQE